MAISKRVSDIWFTSGLGAVNIPITTKQGPKFQTKLGRVSSIFVLTLFACYCLFVELVPWSKQKVIKIERTEEQIRDKNYQAEHSLFTDIMNLTITQPYDTATKTHLSFKYVFEYGTRCSIIHDRNSNETEHLGPQWNSRSHIGINHCLSNCSEIGLSTTLTSEDDAKPFADTDWPSLEDIYMDYGSPCVLGKKESSRILLSLYIRMNQTFWSEAYFGGMVLADNLDGYAKTRNQLELYCPRGYTRHRIVWKQVNVYYHDEWTGNIKREETIFAQDGDTSIRFTPMDELDERGHLCGFELFLRPIVTEMHVKPELLVKVLARIGGAAAILGVFAMCFRFYNNYKFKQKHAEELDLERLLYTMNKVEELVKAMERLSERAPMLVSETINEAKCTQKHSVEIESCVLQ